MKALIILMLLTTVALAQEQSSMQQALGEKLIREVSEAVSCQASILELKKQIAELQKKLSEKEQK